MEIYEFSQREITWLANVFAQASENNRRVRFAFHNGEHGGLQIKVGESIWTHPLGTKESN